MKNDAEEGKRSSIYYSNNEIRCRWKQKRRKRGKSDVGTKGKTQNRIGRNGVDSIDY